MELEKLGEDSLKQFIKTIKELLDKNRKFDLIVGAGDSGQIMVKITQVIYESLGKSCPPTLVVPVYRHEDEAETVLFDNTKLKEDFEDFDLPENIDNVLFVDDEISGGDAVNGTLDLLLTLLKSDDFSETIIAEDGGFTTDKIHNSKVKVEFISPKQRVKDVYNAISYTIPWEFQEPIEKVLKEKIPFYNCKQIMCILLNLPIKEFNEGHPEFNFKLQRQVKSSIPNLEKLQRGYQDYLENHIKSLL